MNQKSTPILVTLLVVAAFLVGMFWQKVQYLEGTKGTEKTTKTGQASPTPNQPQAAEQKVLNSKEATQLVGNSPVKGNAQAKVTIIEFSDFQCPYCGKVQATLKQIFTAYPNQVKLVFKNYPLVS